MQPPKPKINCSICDKPVVLENTKTDEFGRAVHGECYLLKLCNERNHDSVHRPRQVPTVNLEHTI